MHFDNAEDVARYEENMNMLATVARLLQGIDLEYISATLDYAEALGPIVQPTEYRDGGLTNLRDQRKLVNAAKQMRLAANEITAERGGAVIESERRKVFYVCPDCGAEVDTDKYHDPAPEHKWRLEVFKHRCPECGEEHEVWRPEEQREDLGGV